MATWPATVPAPSLEGYGYNPADITARTEMSAGLPRVRRKSVAKFGQLQFNLKLNSAQAAAFESWFYDEAGANGGAAWFEMLVKLPAGTVTKMCRFVRPYESQLLTPDRWQFSAVIEVSYA
ncbi:hypothetical protein Q9292_09850 [Methylophilus sp. VKM B-3414]|uniref:hypothetical protein n=1 Tax=Methylophilus sp. VKM B-3414 TaxID=3076121 RepID=UPI0028C81BCE|nr:hypothetical protein [Methylophilus sp. VKM B-3414]MDT7849914.1 hypothetical protein [Methylophilus sp. VKM B-3414]